METVYIAGKITGDPNYKAKFAKAEKELRAKGCRVLNPARLPDDLRYEQYMPICFAMIDVSDRVHFLKDWKDSTGARDEYLYTNIKRKGIEFE